MILTFGFALAGRGYVIGAEVTLEKASHRALFRALHNAPAHNLAEQDAPRAPPVLGLRERATLQDKWLTARLGRGRSVERLTVSRYGLANLRFPPIADIPLLDVPRPA